MFLRLNHLLEFLDKIHPAEEVDFQDFLVHADVGVQGLLTLRDARIEYKEIDAQVVGNHEVIKSVYGGVVVQLGFGGVGFYAILFAHLFGLVEVVDAQAREDEMAAFLGQVPRDTLPDARASASDECGFIFEV